MAEQVFYSDSNVSVTNARLVIFGKTHAMAGITAVSILREDPSCTLPIVLIIIGLICFAFSWIAAAIIFIGLGVAIWVMQKPIYHLVLESASGSQSAFSSKDLGYISEVEAAINDAIVARG